MLRGLSVSVGRGVLGLCVLWGMTRPVRAAAPQRAEAAFVLAKNRKSMLKTLVPGTHDHFFFHALQAQHNRQFGRAERILSAWKKAHGRTARWQKLVLRQRLLRYDKAPKPALLTLARRLGLRFDHRAAQGTNAAKSAEHARHQKLHQRLRKGPLPALFASRLNAKSAEVHRLYTDLGLRALAAQGKLRCRERRECRALLRRIKRAGFPEVVKLFAAYLKIDKTLDFGGLRSRDKISIASVLTLSELKALRKQVPRLAQDPAFVMEVLRRLRPREGEEWTVHGAVRRRYLERLWSYVKGLNASFSRIQRLIAYHLLQEQRVSGHLSRSLLLRYLRFALPGRYGNWEALSRQQPGHSGKRRAVSGTRRGVLQYERVMGLAWIKDDRATVRAWIAHCLEFCKGSGASKSGFRDFLPMVRASSLKKLHAEVKLLRGESGVEWSKAFSPRQLQQLQKRVELRFLPTNKKRFVPGQRVTLSMAIKNVKRLRIRVFQINALRYYQHHGKEISPTIKLDGLRAHQTLRFRYTDPPIRLVRRRFQLSALRRPGVYVIDVLGGGLRNRALIYVGQLRALVRDTAAGHLFTVVDMAGKVRKRARLWLGQRMFQPDAQGQILVPYTKTRAQKQIILEEGALVSLFSFTHKREKYGLKAHFFLPKEAAMRGGQATLLLRPELRVHGTLLSLSLLKNVSLRITSRDRFGVAVMRTVAIKKLSNEREFVQHFRLPVGLSRLSVRLRAEIENVSTGRRDVLQSEKRFRLRPIQSTQHTESLLLSRTTQGYQLSLRGVTGEPLPKREVTVVLQHLHYKRSIRLRLFTNAKGVVALGTLDGASLLGARAGQAKGSWSLSRERNHKYGALVIAALEGEEVRMPLFDLPPGPWRQHVTLVEQRGGRPFRALPKALRFKHSTLSLRGLSAGKYRLIVSERTHASWSQQRLGLEKSTREWVIHVERGTPRSGVVVGANRSLRKKNVRQPSLHIVSQSSKKLVLGVSDATPAVRVHAIVTHYVPAMGRRVSRGWQIEFGGADVSPLSPRTWRRVSAFFSKAQRLDDELRYILDRQDAKIFPGNMLAQPTLLLNPWTFQQTTTRSGRASGYSGAFGTGGLGRGGGGYGSGGKGRGRVSFDLFRRYSPSLAFLPEAPLVLANLQPNTKGQIVLDTSAFGSRSLVRLLLVQPGSLLLREVALPTKRWKARDLRLQKGLSPQRHYLRVHTAKTQTKAVAAATTQVVRVAKQVTIRSLVDVFGYWQSLRGGTSPSLAPFAFLLKWPTYTAQQKAKFYKDFACHELHFFLYHKDPAFFAAVVKPHLRQKLHKTFLDHWLLGHDLRPYLEMSRWQRLNVVERILLSRRHAKTTQATKRQIREFVEAFPVSPRERRRWRETLYSAKSLNISLADRKKIEERLKKISLLGLISTRKPQKKRPQQQFEPKKDRAMDDKNQDSPVTGKDKKPVALDPSDASQKAQTGGLVKLLNDTSRSLSKEQWRRLRENMEKHTQGLRRKAASQRFFLPPGATKTWAESHYFRVRRQAQNAALIKANAFWLDYARHAGRGGFVSIHLAAVAANRTAALMALAVLDLPFSSTVKKAKPPLLKAVVFAQKLIAQQVNAPMSGLVVMQRLFRDDTDTRSRKAYKALKPFTIQSIYRAEVVISNMTARARKVELLWQMPRGAIAMKGSRVTEQHTTMVGAYQARRFSFFFYFPRPGSFVQFPPHISAQGKVLAFAKVQRFRVLRELPSIDTESWADVSQRGSTKQVLSYLRSHNLKSVDLTKLAWRMREKQAFARITDFLAKARYFVPVLWSYAFKHGDTDKVRSYLQLKAPLVSWCGAFLRSPLVNIDARRGHNTILEHLEFRPLINERVHPFRGRFQILNQGLRAQAHSLYRALIYKPMLSPRDRLELTYLLLVQGDLVSANAMFAQIKRHAITTQMQYDYLRAYLAMSRGEVSVAKTIAARYRDLPVLRWRRRFRQVLRHVAESEGKASKSMGSSRPSQTIVTKQTPSFDLKRAEGGLRLSLRGIRRITVRYYPLDVELAFSNYPFGGRGGAGFRLIMPFETKTQQIPDGVFSLRLALPAKYRAQNVVVEIEAGSKRRAVVLFSHQLNIQVASNHGQLRVAREGEGRGLPKVYVKVYVRRKNGRVSFHKDGYTDLRGRFDYLSRQGVSLKDIERFALLVKSPKYGAKVFFAAPPSQ